MYILQAVRVIGLGARGYFALVHYLTQRRNAVARLPICSGTGQVVVGHLRLARQLLVVHQTAGSGTR